MRNGELVEKSQAAPLESGTGIHVISDIMEPTKHMADGQYYTSKSAFRKVTRAYGCLEVGNETPTLMKPREPVKLDRRKRADDIRRAIYDLRNRSK
jgi:hypothetical protein